MSGSDIEHRIAPPGRWPELRLRELWAYRELLGFLAWRDIKVRYTQAAIGAAWALLQPALMVVVFTVFLGRLAKVPSDGLPYPVFALAGLVPWTFFANSLGSCTESVVANSNLVSKVYFPRLLVPTASVVAWLPDLGIASVLVVIVMAVYGIAPNVVMIFLPLFALLALTTALAVGLWLAALNVSFRDVRYAVPFVIQLWLFATPVVYPASLVPERWRALLGLNPMSGVVEGFRWALLGQAHPSWAMLAVSVCVTLAVLVSGLVFFQRSEHRFADVI